MTKLIQTPKPSIPMMRFLLIFLFAFSTFLSSGQSVDFISDQSISTSNTYFGPGDGSHTVQTIGSVSNVDISDCSSIEFSLNVVANQNGDDGWGDDVDDLDLISESPCSGNTCAGSISDYINDVQSGSPSYPGDCGCWDFMSIRLYVDGVLVVDEFLGDEDTDEPSPISYQSCVDASTLDLELLYSASDSDEEIGYSSIALVCWQNNPDIEADLDPVCENSGDVVTISETGATADVSTWSWSTGSSDPNFITDDTYTATSETYTVTTTDANNCTNTAEVSIDVDPQPAVQNTTLTACEDSPGSGQADFTLTDAEDASGASNTGGTDIDDGATDVTVTYHDSQTGAEGGTDINDGTDQTNGTIVYARVEDNITGCFSVAEVTLVIPAPPTVQNTTLIACEDSPGSGQADFTLTDAEDALGASNIGDDADSTTGGTDIDDGATDVTVTYHDSQTGAEGGTDINDGTDQTNGTIVYARVEDNITGCFSVAEVTLVIPTPPTANATTLQSCPSFPLTNPLTADFTLTDAEDASGASNTGGADVDDGATDVTVTYHDSQTGAEGGTDINDGTAQTDGTIVYARVEDNNTGCFSVAEVTLVIPTPPTANPTTLVVCANSNGDGEFMLTDAEDEAGETNAGDDGDISTAPGTDVDNGEDANVTVTYYATSGEAEAPDDNTPIDTSNPYVATDGSSVYAVVHDGTCFGIAEITLSVSPAPTNSDCGSAEDASSGSVSGTNACATPDPNGYCSLTSTDDSHVVYYTYTSGSATSTVQFAVVGGSTDGATDLRLGVWTDCNATEYSDTNPVAMGDACVGNVTFACVAPGTSVTIAVGSPDGSEGTFDLTIIETASAGPNNDTCDGTLPDMTPSTTCIFESFMTNNTDACPEQFAISGCGMINQEPVVYAQISVPTGLNNPTLEIESIAGPGTPYVVVSNEMSDCTAPDPISGCLTGNGTDGTPISVTSGSTYTLIIGSDMEGEISFNVKINAPPANDECTAAEDANASSGSVSGTNACATPDPNGFCSLSTNFDESHTVYYAYTVQSTTNTSVTFVGTPTTASAVSLGVWTDCNPTEYSDTNPVAMGDACAADVTFDCVAPGTEFIIAVGSPHDSEGEFMLNITETASAVPDNDACDGTLPDMTPSTTCIFEPFMTNNTDACPELFSISGCGIMDQEPVVYAQISVPSGLNNPTLEIENIAGSGNPYVVVSNEMSDCTAPDPVSPCLTGNGTDGTPIPVTSGNTYTLIIGSDMEGDISFNVKINAPPPNDECANADALSQGSTTAGTTECATVPLTGTCNDAVSQSTVWYTYVVGADAEVVGISVENFGGTGDIFVAAGLDGCGDPFNAMTQTDLSTAQYCGAPGTNLLELSLNADGECLSVDDEITIVVASAAGEPEGTFDITVDEVTPNPAVCHENENCDEITVNPFGTITTNDPAGPTCNQICNIYACGEQLCGGTVYNTVYYEFTTDGDAAFTDGTDVSLSVSVGGGIASPVITVFEAGCGTAVQSAAGTPIECLGTNDTGPIEVTGNLLPNTTYVVMVGTADNVGGTDDLCIEITTGCVNDECADAIEINESTPFSGTNNGCTVDEDTGEWTCGSAIETSSSWFVFTLPAGNSGADITISNTTTSYSVQTFDGSGGCGGLMQFTEPTESDCSSPTLLELRCLTADTDYYIQFSTAAGDETTVDINVDFLTPTETSAPVNDLCDGAIDLQGDPCTPFTVNVVDLLKACPDEYLGTGGVTCAFTGNTVWYQVTLPSTGYGLGFENISAGNAYVLVLSAAECPPTSYLDNCVTEGQTTGGMPYDILGLTGGDTYYIAASNEDNTDFSFDLTIYEAPLGDDPAGFTASTDDDVVDLGSGGGSSSTTTCCALGSNDTDSSGNSLDYPFQNCNGTINDAVVWFMFTTIDTDDGYTIDVSFSSGSGGFEVYELAPGGKPLGESCNASQGIEIANCYPTGTEIWIAVGSQQDECGMVSVEVKSASCSSPFADVCDELDWGAPLTPIAEGSPVCMTTCNQYACTESTDCGGTEASVWVPVQTDLLTTSLIVTINGNNFTPQVTSYVGTDCTDIQQLNGMVSCENTIPIVVGAGGDQMVFFNISAEEGGDLGEFDFCVSAVSNSFDCYEGELVVSRPEYPDADPAGPYCQGETVEFCVEIDFTIASPPAPDGNNCQWLQGIVPVIHNGWDLLANPLDAQTAPSSANGGTVQWLPEGSVEYNFPNPNYGIITLPNNSLGIAYANGDGTPFNEGTGLPAGWWITSNGGSGCDNDGDPDTMYGDGPAGCNGNQNYQFCFTLTTKLQPPADCADQELSDLAVEIFVFADGETGCWTDLSCALSTPLQFDGLMECDLPPSVDADDKEICTGSPADVEVATSDGSVATIVVTPVNNPNISGAMDHEFSGGNGVIPDVLVNNTTTAQVQVYELTATVDGLVCEGPVTEVEVTVYPELMITFNVNDPEPICFGEEKTFTPVIVGGDGSGNYTYEWTDGSTDSSITINNDESGYPVGINTMCVTIMDDLGCMDTECFNFDIRPEILIELDGEESFCVSCPDGYQDVNPVFTIDYEDVSDEQIDINNPEWVITLDEDGFDDMDSENHLAHLDLGLDGLEIFNCLDGLTPYAESTPGIYYIRLTGFDQYGCPFTSDVHELIVGGGPDVVVNVLGCTTDGTEYQILGTTENGDRVKIDVYDSSDLAQVIGTDKDELNITLVPGTYTIISTDTETDCETIQELVVPNGTEPTIDAPAVCEGGNGVATITNASDYSNIDWTATDSGPTYTIINLLEDSTFVITLTDNGGCESIHNVTIPVNQKPTASISGSTSFCDGSSTTLTASGGDTYLWSDASTGTTLVVNSPGTVSVTVTDTNGCTGESSVDVSQQNNLVIQGDTITICNDGVTTYTFDAGANNPNYTFDWSDDANNNGTVSGGICGDVSTAGIYTVTVTDTQAGCTGIGTFILSHEEPQVITLADDPTRCNSALGVGSKLDLTTMVVNGTGDWIDVGPTFGSDFVPNNLDFVGKPAGNYQFAFCSTAQTECPQVCDTLTVLIEDCSCPTADISDINPICNGSDATVNLDSKEFPTDAGTWSFIGADAGMTLVNANAADSELNVPVGTASGIYTLTYALDNLDPACGLVADTLMFEIVEQPVAAVTQDELQACDAVPLTGSVSNILDIGSYLDTSSSAGTWSVDNSSVDIANINSVDFSGLPLNTVVTFTYTTNVAGTNGPCDDVSASIEVTVIDCSCPFIQTTQPGAMCTTSGALDLSTLLVAGTAAGTWSLGTSGTGDNSTVQLTTDNMFVVNDATAAGTYEVIYTLDGQQLPNCTWESPRLIVVNAPPVVLFNPATACNEVPQDGSTLDNTLDLNNYFMSGSSMSGTWSTNVTGLDLSDPTNVDFAGFMDQSPITITFTTDNASSPCDNVPGDLIVTVQDCACPAIGTSDPGVLCTNSSALDLTTFVTDGVGSWSLGTAGTGDVSTVNLTNDVFTVNDTSTQGTYEVIFKLTDPKEGCDSTSTQFVTVNVPPVVSFDVATACNAVNNSGTADSHELDLTSYFTDGSETSGTWSTNVTGLDLSDPTNVDFTGQTAGDQVIITFTTNTAVLPCSDPNANLIVNVIDCTCPNLTVTNPDNVCNSGATIDLADSETPTNESGSWAADLGNPSEIIQSGTILTIDGSVTAGTYTFIFTPDNTPEVNCPQTSEVTFEVMQVVEAGEGGSATYCAGETDVVSLFSLLTGADTGGTWMETSDVPSLAGFDVSQSTFYFANELPATYTFTYMLSGDDPCSDDDATVSIIVEAIPEADAGQDVILDCSGDPAILGGNGTSAQGDYTYLWTNLAGDTVQISTTESMLSTLTADDYTLTVIDNNSMCSESDNVTVDVDPELPQLSVDVCTDMGSGTIFINEASGSNAPLTLQITNPDGTVTEVTNPQSGSQINNLAAGNYTVVLVDAIDCRSSQESLIVVDALQIINNTTEADTVEYGTTYTLNANDFIVGDLDNATYEWTNDSGEVLCAGAAEDCESLDVLVERAEYICLKVIDDMGCVNEDCIYLRLSLDNQIYTPNIFNPDVDNNNWLYPQTDKDAIVTEFKVYDRWGSLIFERKDFPSNVPELGWDGRFNNTKAEQGVYVYLYTVQFPSGEIKSIVKDITLIR